VTPEERLEKIEKAQATLTDQMTVAARLAEESQKRFNRQADDLWEFVSYVADAQKHGVEALGHLREIVQALAVKVDALADRQSSTQAALDSLIVNIDRFVQGQGGNGEPGPKRGS
jgi:ABC-type transporter Mla subunit MlaD